WQRYYTRWRAATPECLDVDLLELMQPLAALCPPGTVIDKTRYFGFAQLKLLAHPAGPMLPRPVQHRLSIVSYVLTARAYMLKSLQNNIVLWVQAKTGLSGGFLISLAVAGGAALLTFVFLCVTGYVWLSIQLGPVFGGLAM